MNTEIRLIKSILNQIKRELNTPYEFEVQRAIIDNFTYPEVANFLRNTPFRKVFLVEYQSHLKENAPPIEEIQSIFEISVQLFSLEFGESLPKFEVLNLRNLLSVSDFEEFEKNKTIEGVSWTPHYEGGAYFGNLDYQFIKVWKLDSNYLVLQKSVASSEQESVHFVFATLTPNH